MELNKTYHINIINQIDKSSFIVVERFSRNSTQYFLDYYKKLLNFNHCGEWFQKLDSCFYDFGTILLVQVNKKLNLWARGIMSKPFDILPEIYLIDSQRFFTCDNKFMIKNCPYKFTKLIVPTYYINIDNFLDDYDLKHVFEILINKNRYEKINFGFIPKSIQNNVYTGELIINDEINSFISLKNFLKDFHINKKFDDMSEYQQQSFSIFNPLQNKCLRNIFIPKNPSNKFIFLDDDTYSDSGVCGLNSSLENCMCDTSDECSSNLDQFEDICISDDSVLANKKTQNYNIKIENQNVYSSFNPSLINNNCSLNSMYSIEEGHNLSVNSITSMLNGNTEDNKKSTTLETTADYSKDNNTINNIQVSTNTNSKSNTKNNKNIFQEIKKNDFVDPKETKSKIKTFMKNRSQGLLKLSNSKTNQCESNNLIKPITSETSQTSSKCFTENKNQSNSSLADESNIWWSSDDER